MRLPGGRSRRAYVDLDSPTTMPDPGYSAAELADQLRQAGITPKGKRRRRGKQPRDRLGQFAPWPD